MQAIDYSAIRSRISSMPIATFAVKKKPKKVVTPEELEARRERDRVRQANYRATHLDHCHEAERNWRLAHPEECRAKRQRNYDRHKDDPEFKRHRVEKHKEYMERLKADPVRYAEFKAKRNAYKRRRNAEKAAAKLQQEIQHD